MNISIDFIAVLQGIIIFILAAGVKALFSMSRCLTSLTTWKTVHEEQEKQWHKEIREDHKELWEGIKAIRDNE